MSNLTAKYQTSSRCPRCMYGISHGGTPRKPICAFVSVRGRASLRARWRSVACTCGRRTVAGAAGAYAYRGAPISAIMLEAAKLSPRTCSDLQHRACCAAVAACCLQPTAAAPPAIAAAPAAPAPCPPPLQPAACQRIPRGSNAAAAARSNTNAAAVTASAGRLQVPRFYRARLSILRAITSPIVWNTCTKITHRTTDTIITAVFQR